jgi:hypothetical protein
MQAMPRLRRSALGGAIVLLLILPTAIAATEDAPERGRAEVDATETTRNTAPIVDVATVRSEAELELLHLAPVEPEDRGSSFTDAGLGQENVPNVIERAKLAMARAAIEAARAAGTLNMTAAPGPLLPPAPADIEAIKLEQLNNPAPITMPAEAGIDGVGGGLEPLQLSGPQEPSAEELAKLQQSWPATPNSDVPVVDQPVSKDEPQTAESAESKEVR